MDLTEILRSITGLNTPTPAPVAAAAQPDPAGGVRTPPPAAGGAPTIAPPPPAGAPAGPAPGTGDSPPDMTQLYQKLLNQQRADKYINSGMHMLAAGFAQPQNRAALISAANSGGSGDTSASSALSTILSLQKDQQAKALRAQQLARLPAIAKQYGLDMNTVQYLFETGKLDETINTMAQPDNVVEKRADGSTYLLNKKTGSKLKELEGADPERNLTTDLKELDRVNAERLKSGKEIIPAETWLIDMAKNKANKTEITGDKLEVKAGEMRLKELSESADAARSGIQVQNKLGEAAELVNRGIISGSMASEPMLAGRKMLAQVFGLPDEVASNTDTFKSQMKEIVLPRVKALGTGNSISNADVKFVTEAVGADIALTEDTIREVIRRMSRLERNNAMEHNRRAGAFRAIPGNEKAGKYVDDVALPAFNPAIAGPKNIATLQAEAAKGGEARDKIVKYFNESYGPGAAESVLGVQ